MVFQFVRKSQIIVTYGLILSPQSLNFGLHLPAMMTMPAKRPGPHAKNDAQDKNTDRKGREERQNTLQKSLVTHFVPQLLQL